MSGHEKGEKGKKAHLKAQLSLRPSPASFLLLSYLSLSRTRSPPPAYARALRPTRPPLPALVPAAAGKSPCERPRRPQLLLPHRRPPPDASPPPSAPSTSYARLGVRLPPRPGDGPRLAINRVESRLGERLAEQGLSINLQYDCTRPY